RLWDTDLPWSGEIIGQKDVEVISVSYAIVKRLAELTEGFDRGLLEIRNISGDKEEVIEARRTLVNNFWERYFETSRLVEYEMFKGNSQVENDRNLIALTHSYLNDTSRSDIESLLNSIVRLGVDKQLEL